MATIPPDVEQLHPYVGYCYRPTGAQGPWQVNEFGFRGAPPSREPDVVNILILGGSVASALAQRGVSVLSPGLADRWNIAPERIQIVNGALGGYRAPQHLFVLHYLLVLGHHIHAVVLLDGFNEVALYPSEDSWLGLHPVLPRNWAGRAHPSLLGRTARMLDAWADTPDRHGSCRWCARFRQRFLNRTARWLRARNYGRLARSGLLSTLPAAPFPPDGAMAAHLAGQWARCSALIAGTCDARGIAFTHFLQPNQYLRAPDHAVPSPVYHPDAPYRAGAVSGYPELRREGEALRTRSVDFHDLSDVLDGIAMREAYIDACCHLSEMGNMLLARAMIARMPAPRMPV